jgi:hypothetical protein
VDSRCILLAVMLAACSRNSSPASGQAASTSTVAPASTPPPIATGAPQFLARLNAWNDALDSHNVPGLEALYFDDVCYYGRVVAVDALLKQKKDSLGAGSTFRQHVVGDVKAGGAQDGFVVVRFTKRSGPAARLRDTPARLVLRQDLDGKELRILEEADDSDPGGGATADACAQTAWSAVLQERCEDTASRAVNAIPRVKQVVDALLEASTDDRALGGFGAQDNGDGTFSASIGVHTRDRFEGHVDYTVDRGTGHLAVRIDGTDVTVPEEVQQELATACKP